MERDGKRMRSGGYRFAIWAAVLGLLCGSAAARVPAGEQTALDRYVAAPDPSYRYELVRVTEQPDCRIFMIDMTSQTWLTTKEVDRPVWKHWLLIIEPSQVVSPIGMLFIDGGSDGARSADPALVKMALGTGSVVADLQQVPNQPLTFANDGRPRVEDALIAYTWDKFLHTGDEKWPARLPMTKAAVRAMDTITAFCASEQARKITVNKFVVAGASKRGWTTWTTAAVDDRVVAIAPIVIDTLNVPLSAAHHFAAYGFWSEALKDYNEMKIDQWAGTPQYQALMKIEDPYSYRTRYTMPKLLINAAGDQYFLPDNSQFYFDDLPAPRYLRYVPNADHSLRQSDAAQTLAAFYQMILSGARLPQLRWKMEPDGSIRAQAADKPAQTKLWRATNPSARDFRLQTIGRAWKSTDLSADAGGNFIAKVDPPARGWTAFFIELTYPCPAGPPLKLTTQVRVVPDVLPFKDKLPLRGNRQ